MKPPNKTSHASSVPNTRTAVSKHRKVSTEGKQSMSNYKISFKRPSSPRAEPTMGPNPLAAIPSVTKPGPHPTEKRKKGLHPKDQGTSD